MERQTLKQSLIGAFEIFLMMPSCVERFTSNKKDAIKSFIYPLLLYPLVLWSFSVVKGVSDSAVLSMHALLAWGGTFGFYAVIYYVSGRMERREDFWRFVNMANTQSIISFFLLIPIFLTVYNHVTETVFFHQYWVFYILVDLAFTAFIAAKSLRLNWYLGGFLASIALMFSDVGNRLLAIYMQNIQDLLV